MIENIQDTQLVTFCLLTYNQEAFITDALHGALNQTYSPLEIIISDDGSTDKTREIINEVINNYKGEHKIIINFNEVNLGLATHFSKVCLEMASGDYIIIAAGDDISFPERTSTSVKFLEEHPESYIADFGVDYIDEKGNKVLKRGKTKDLSFDLKMFVSGSKMGTMGCSRIYRKKLFEVFGALDPLCPTEDSTGVFRALLLGKIWVLKEIVVLYRIHSSSISTPQNMIRLKIKKIFNQYLLDLEKAMEMGLVTKIQYNELQKKLHKMFFKRQIERGKNILKLNLRSVFRLLSKRSIKSFF